MTENTFARPDISFRSLPFWSWNCRVTRELIDRQLPIFKEMGFGGVTIHARQGLDVEYLSEEYFSLVSYTIARCKELGLRCWLYDDDKFPSGSAGGKVTKGHPEFRGRYLLLTEKPDNGYVAAYALFFEGNALKEYRRLMNEQEIDAARQAGGVIRYAYMKLINKEAWFEDEAYVDTMNPEATKEFIRLTHEAFYARNGADFGATVPAIFTDEPRIGKQKQISAALSHEDVILPYNDYFAACYQARYGQDPLDIVPDYIWDRPDGAALQNRYRYRDTTAECFATAYMDEIASWCREHRIAMTGHVLGEETLGSQAMTVGECMRAYRRMDIPGIDILCDFHEFSNVLQAASVSHQFGREGVASELYGVTHWDCDFKTFKLQGDWQAALGVTHRVPHLSHMSLGGEAKRDWPGSIFFHAPWYREFGLIEDHFARLNSVLRKGRPVVRIGVIHPIESYWLRLGPENTTAAARKSMDEAFRSLTEKLLFRHLNFDFLSESLLPDLYKDEGDDLLHVGPMACDAVILPNLTTIRSTTLNALEKFHRQGGDIYFLGDAPSLVDAVPNERAERLAKKSVHAKDIDALCVQLEKHRTVSIENEAGEQADNLLYQLRQDGQDKWLFICHVYKTESEQPEKIKITLPGCYAVEAYDTLNGKTEQTAYQTIDNQTIIFYPLYGEDSVLFRLTPGRKSFRSLAEKDESHFETIAKINLIKSFDRREPNALLLDFAAWQIEDGEIHPTQEILRADNAIRAELGYFPRNERICQPYHMADTPAKKVTLYYTIHSHIKVSARLAIEELSACRVWLNGQEADRTVRGYYVDPALSVIDLPALQPGENHLRVEVQFRQKSNLEPLYLLGDFDVVFEDAVPWITEKSPVLSWGDITKQGMPFYTGNLIYSFSVDIPETAEYFVRVPAFSAPVLKVWADDREGSLVAFSPHRASLGVMEKGKHTIHICLYGNRFNGFGTLHNANTNYTWYGPDSFRTTGENWTDGYCLRPVGIMTPPEIQKKEEQP